MAAKPTKPQRAAAKRAQGKPKPKRAAPPPKTKLDALIAALSSPKGATLQRLMAATGWQAHSVRGAISGALKKQRGLAISSSKESGERVYRITARP